MKMSLFAPACPELTVRADVPEAPGAEGELFVELRSRPILVVPLDACGEYRVQRENLQLWCRLSKEGPIVSLSVKRNIGGRKAIDNTLSITRSRDGQVSFSSSDFRQEEVPADSW